MMASINLVSERYSSRSFHAAVFVVQMTLMSLLQQAKLVVAEPGKFTMIRPGGTNYDHKYSAGVKLGGQRCEEIYVVREGETLHSISDKCGDPFILEQNPHVQESDDVFPGLVIKITSSTTSSPPPSTPTMFRKFLM